MRFGLVLALVAALYQAPSAPALSEVEQLTLANLNLQAQLAEVLQANAACQAELGPARAQVHQTALQDQRAAFTARVERAHPGYTVDLRTGQLVAKK
jgi:hypothetical protein